MTIELVSPSLFLTGINIPHLLKVMFGVMNMCDFVLSYVLLLLYICCLILSCNTSSISLSRGRLWRRGVVAILSSADHLRDVNVDHLRDAISQNAIIWTLLVVGC